MRNSQLQPLALLLLSGNTLAQLCQTSSLATGVNPKVTDFAAFEDEVAPFTATATGANIPVYTNTVNLGATAVTAVGYAKSDALESAGYTVTSAWVTAQAPCPASTLATVTTQTGVLPPKPSGNCTAHGDHWHCDEEHHDDDEHDHDHDTPTTTTTGTGSAVTPSTPSPTNGKNCEAHGDHWHCDDDEDDHSSSKTTPSSTTGTPSIPSPTDGVNCEAHGDHWHCDNDDDEDDHSAGNKTAQGNATTLAPVKEEDSAAGGLRISASLIGVVGAALAVWML